MFYTDPPSMRHSAFCGPTAVLQLRRRRAASDGMGGYGSLGRQSWERRRSTPSVAESYMTKKMFRRRSDQQPRGERALVVVVDRESASCLFEYFCKLEQNIGIFTRQRKQSTPLTFQTVAPLVVVRHVVMDGPPRLRGIYISLIQFTNPRQRLS